jgi:hypothetical protein
MSLRRSHDLVATTRDMHGVGCPIPHCAAYLDPRKMTVKDEFTLESNRFNPCGDAHGPYFDGLTHRGRIAAIERWRKRFERNEVIMRWKAP